MIFTDTSEMVVQCAVKPLACASGSYWLKRLPSGRSIEIETVRFFLLHGHFPDREFFVEQDLYEVVYCLTLAAKVAGSHIDARKSLQLACANVVKSSSMLRSTTVSVVMFCFVLSQYSDQ